MTVGAGLCLVRGAGSSARRCLCTIKANVTTAKRKVVSEWYQSREPPEARRAHLENCYPKPPGSLALFLSLAVSPSLSLHVSIWLG